MTHDTASATHLSRDLFTQDALKLVDSSYWLGEMHVGKATPFSMFFPLNSLLTALHGCHTNLKSIQAQLHETRQRAQIGW